LTHNSISHKIIDAAPKEYDSLPEQQPHDVALRPSRSRRRRLRRGELETETWALIFGAKDWGFGGNWRCGEEASWWGSNGFGKARKGERGFGGERENGGLRVWGKGAKGRQRVRGRN